MHAPAADLNVICLRVSPLLSFHLKISDVLLCVQVWFVLLYGSGIAFGGIFGYIIAMGMKGTAMKVLGYALGMCVTLPVVSLLWCPSACDRDG